jgi:hypothetical protein
MPRSCTSSTAWERDKGTHFAVGLELVGDTPSSAPHSSRICPANDQETSRNGRIGWSSESTGHAPDPRISAGSEMTPENTLKVETRFKSRCGRKPSQSPGSPLGRQRGRTGSSLAQRQRDEADNFVRLAQD